MSAVTKDDPRMARLLGEYPRLDRWPQWRMSETLTSYLAIGSGVWRRLLVVADKETLELRHLASGHRLSKRWSPLSPTDYQGVSNPENL
jgi:hypothetical protein